MRKKIVAGNWKMNKTLSEAKDFILGLNRIALNHPFKCEAVICPPSLYLKFASQTFQHKRIKVGAQNVSEYENGAYTGEISAEMLQSMETEYAIIGHSERREKYNDSDDRVVSKAKMAIKYSITPIICVGETLDERKRAKHLDKIKAQTEKIFDLGDDFSKIVLAYEPIWAIGTGETATPNQAQEIHKFIRTMIADKFGADVAHNLSILYGGSVNSNNAAELFSQEDIDGGLIGGASLNLTEFQTIINIMDRTIA